MNKIVLVVVLLTFAALGIQITAGMMATDSPSIPLQAGSPTDRTAERLGIAPVTAESAIGFQEPELSETSFVDQAYAAIPHRRTEFDPTNPSILPSHREYLHQVMALIDQAVLWRVSGLQAVHQNSPNRERWAQAGARLIQSLERLQPPPEARRYQAYVLDAFDAYRHYFQVRAFETDAIDLRNLNDDPVMIRASNAARAAYHELKSIYPNRDAAAEASFYDAHHALDPL